mmetsp:Transcript_29712/g.52973  ORF Transcript_29712/g.52973 Transcript_29712/m.52973 type:complete len:196 (-) Transcript_29712:801-1388(-)
MAGVYRGTTYEQDPHYRNKEKRLLEETKWPSEYSQRVDMKKIKLEAIQPWVDDKVKELLEIEDEILVNLIMCTLEEPDVCPKQLTITLTPMLEDKARPFVLSLWKLLISAQADPKGVPQEVVDQRKRDLQKAKELLEAQSRQLRNTRRRSRSPRKVRESSSSDSNSSYFVSSDSSPRGRRRRYSSSSSDRNWRRR